MRGDVCSIRRVVLSAAIRAVALSACIASGLVAAAASAQQSERDDQQNHSGDGTVIEQFAVRMFDEAYERTLRLLTDPPTELVVEGPALDWGYATGPDLTAALRLSETQSEAAGAAVGYMVLHWEGRGRFFGVYNVRSDGRSVVGAFWREGGDPTNGEIAGHFEIGSERFEGASAIGAATLLSGETRPIERIIPRSE